MKTIKKGWLQYRHGGWQIHLPLSSFHNQKAIEATLGSTKIKAPVTLTSTTPSIKQSAFPIQCRDLAINKVKAGPFIGILTVRTNNRLRGNKENFQDLILVSKQFHAITFVFTPEDVNWNEGTVNGLTYVPLKRGWHKLTFPIPDVVYNRIPYRELEQLPYVQKAIARLKKVDGLKLFNPHFFNKWEICKIIQNSSAYKYLPKTILLQDKESFINMIDQFNTLYLKPIDGKAGEGIYRITRGTDGFTISYSQKGKGQSHPNLNLEQLWNFVKRVTQKRPYLLQEAIPLLTYQNSPFDARVLIQKNEHGKWGITGIGVRVAGSHGITTHVPQGGSIIRAESAFLPHFGETGTKQTLNKIGNAALEIAHIYDQHYDHLGEMSMDLGVSPDRDIWFFEANAKPMKFDEPEIRQRSLERIIQYSLHLSSFVS